MSYLSGKFGKGKVIVFSVITLVLILSVFLGVFAFSYFLTSPAEKIFFLSNSKSISDIFSMDTDGSNLKNITNRPAFYTKPVCSPDGEQIAFLSDRNGTWKVYIMSFDGTGLIEVKGATSLDTPYSWSPDGRYLLVESLRDINSQIYAIDLTKGTSQNLSNNAFNDMQPAWSPDGKKIIFISDRERNNSSQVYVLDVELCKVTKISNNEPEQIESPMFSPDGQKILYNIGDKNKTKIVATDIEGKQLKEISINQPGWAVPQAWSSDGSKLLVDIISGSGNDKMHKPLLVNFDDNNLIERIENSYSSKASYYTWSKVSKNVKVDLPQLTVQETKNDFFTNPDLLIKNATIIDGIGKQPISGMSILIRNGKIEKLGEKIRLENTENIKEIDLNGAYVLPGFINAHVHHAYDPNNLNRWAQEGVTTVRDLGAYVGWDIFSFRDKIKQKPAYASIVAAGPIFTAPGGYPYGSYSMEVGSASEAQKRVNTILNQGADVIKMALESGNFMQRDFPIINDDITKSIVDVAHERKTITVAHTDIMNSEYLSKALAAGVDDIAHIPVANMTDEIITKMVEKGVFVEPTIEVYDYNNYTVIENLRKYVLAGGKVALGTDYGGSVFGLEMELGMPMKEIGYMSEAGMTPMQIIVAATKNAAYVCNRQNEIGTIETNKEADLLILNSNPLIDLNNLKDIKMVINNGVVIRN